MSSIQIKQVRNTSELKTFIRFPYSVYRNDPCWIAPLEFERHQFFSRKKNPFFKYGDAEYFLALRGEEVVGRISAQIDSRHIKTHNEKAGFFGCFESIDDPAVAKTLLTRAAVWLEEKGMEKIRGPFNFTINGEMGILIDGFDTPPVMLMNHNPRYYPVLMESSGFQKAKDVYAWRYDMGQLNEQAVQLADTTRQYPGLTIRSINMKNFEAEVRLIMDIFNEVWVNNWGFIPFSEEEVKQLAKEMKPFVDPEMIFFAEVNGETAAMSMCIPNVNEAIRDLKGKLFPFGLLKIMWRLKRGLKSGRFWAMGIRKPYRGSALGALSVLMNVEMHVRGIKRGYKMCELSWTLEDNDRINKGIEFMGGKKYKTYRIYEKAL